MTLIYHIAAAADWERAVRDGQYTMSTRGLTLAEQGFIHASTAEQVPLVANAFYRDVPDLLLLVIDTERVGPEIRYEPVPGQVPRLSPHLRPAQRNRRGGGPAVRSRARWSVLLCRRRVLSERAAEEVELEQEQVLRHRLLGCHVRDAGQW